MMSGGWNRSYFILLIVSFFSWLGYNMAAPILVEYLTGLGLSLSAAGVVSGLFAFSSMGTRPISGLLTDRVSHKSLLVISQLVMAAAMLSYSIIPVESVIYVCRIIHGIAFAVSSTVSLILASEKAPQDKMAQGISYYSTAQVLAMLLGPGLGIALAERMGFYSCMVISASTSIPALLCSLLIEDDEEKNLTPSCNVEVGKRFIQLSDILEIPALGLSMMTASLTLMVGMGSTFLVSFAMERQIEGVSLHFTVNAVTLLILRLTMSKFMERFSKTNVLRFVFLAGTLSTCCIVFSNGLPLLIVSAIFKALAYGIGQPVLQTEALQRAGEGRKGVAGGTIYIGGDMGQALSGILGGAIVLHFGYTALFAVTAIPLFFFLIKLLYKPLKYDHLAGRV